MGRLALDPKTGDALVDYAVVCAEPTPTGVRIIDTGLAYDRQADALTGTFVCRSEAPAPSTPEVATATAPRQEHEDLPSAAVIDLPKPVRLVLEQYAAVLRESPNLEECAKRFLRIAGGKLVNEDGTALAPSVQRFTLERDFASIKSYAHPLRVTRVTKQLDTTSGFGATLIRGDVYKIWIAKKPGVPGPPAPVSILWPKGHATIQQPKIIGIGSL